ncbi:MAG: hypothetical protein FRX48_00503 [Lasallia pustulata]|uniref:Uncharacterized protein n=1 Tax=Lasallia pustulata TaxID=136370 RepID=A0A5M8Q3K0_9LECA|nr:MAG: hypothetical protein FRX48_00503 [Lasallia pustulata]
MMKRTLDNTLLATARKMPRLQGLETTLKQLNLSDLSSAFNYLTDDKTRWQNETDRSPSIQPLRAQAIPPLHPPTQTSTQATLHPTTAPEPRPFPTPDSQQITRPFSSQTIAPTPLALHNPQHHPLPSPPTPALTSPATIPKNPPSIWLTHIPCSVFFSPSTPRATWPWPDWVSDAFETGDALWYTLGSDAKGHVNVRARRQDLVEFFDKVGAGEGMVDERGGGKEGVEVLASGKMGARAKARVKRGDGRCGLGKTVAEELEAMRMDAEMMRVGMEGKGDESGEGRMGDWEVLEGDVVEEEWVDVWDEWKIGGWAKVRREVRSGGEDEDVGTWREKCDVVQVVS